MAEWWAGFIVGVCAMLLLNVALSAVFLVWLKRNEEVPRG